MTKQEQTQWQVTGMAKWQTIASRKRFDVMAAHPRAEQIPSLAWLGLAKRLESAAERAGDQAPALLARAVECRARWSE